MFDKFTVILLTGFMAWPASAEPFVKESAFWAVEVENGELDPAPLRIPQTPLIVDLEDKGRQLGGTGRHLAHYGHTIQRCSTDGSLWLCKADWIRS